MEDGWFIHNIEIMRKYRRKYYDLFSHFYDSIIRLHSQDKSLYLRHYLAKKSGVQSKDLVLDLCTGTGSLALVLSNYAGKGLVIGVDFSKGMLTKARNKVKLLRQKNIKFIMADAGFLPFKAGVFDVIACSHSMYELTGGTRKRALAEIKRILKENGYFCMMEHERPDNAFIRFLYRIRIFSMGREGLNIIKNELNELRKIFSHVEKEVTATGRSKLICAQK